MEIVPGKIIFFKPWGNYLMDLEDLDKDLFNEWYQTIYHFPANITIYSDDRGNIQVEYDSYSEKEQYESQIADFRDFLNFINYEFIVIERVVPKEEEGPDISKREMKKMEKVAEKAATETIKESTEDHIADRNDVEKIIEEEKKQLSEMPNIENYIDPLNKTLLQEASYVLEKMLEQYKPKFEETKKILWLKKEGIEIKDAQLKAIVTEEVNGLASHENKFNYIIDTSSYFHYANSEEEVKAIQSIRQINQDYLNKEVALLEEKGTLILLLDFQYINQIYKALQTSFGEKIKQKLFVKNYIVNKVPFISFMYIQKFSTSNTESDFSSTKVLCYEQLRGENQSKPESCLISELSRALTYIYEMYQYEGFLKELQPGKIIPIKIKEKIFHNFKNNILQEKNQRKKILLKLMKLVLLKKYHLISFVIPLQLILLKTATTYALYRSFLVIRTFTLL